MKKTTISRIINAARFLHIDISLLTELSNLTIYLPSDGDNPTIFNISMRIGQLVNLNSLSFNTQEQLLDSDGLKNLSSAIE